MSLKHIVEKVDMKQITLHYRDTLAQHTSRNINRCPFGNPLSNQVLSLFFPVNGVKVERPLARVARNPVGLRRTLAKSSESAKRLGNDFFKYE